MCAVMFAQRKQQQQQEDGWEEWRRGEMESRVHKRMLRTLRKWQMSHTRNNTHTMRETSAKWQFIKFPFHCIASYTPLTPPLGRVAVPDTLLKSNLMRKQINFLSAK